MNRSRNRIANLAVPPGHPGRCKGKTASGGQCSLWAKKGKKFCFGHDPSPEGRALRAERPRGGRPRNNKPDVVTPNRSGGDADDLVQFTMLIRRIAAGAVRSELADIFGGGRR